MKIIRLKRKSKKLREFKDTAWKEVHPKLYGKEYNIERWKEKRLEYKATINGKAVGALSGDYMAGVLHLKELIISPEHRGKGIGTALIAEVEKDAKKLGLHFAYFETGKDWEALKLYERLGYKIIAELKNFYDNTDFLLMSKEL